MKDNKKSTVIRLIVCVAVLAVLLPVGFLTKVFNFRDIFNGNTFNIGNILKLIVMILSLSLIHI